MDIPQKRLDIGKYFKIFFTGFLLLLLSFAPNRGMSVENNTKTNSLSFRNKPFNEVVDILCNQYNVEIFYDKALVKHSISGEYFNIPLENMLERMLKGKNISILTSSENNTIDIRLFGESNIGLVESAGSQSKSKSTHSVDPFTQKTIAKLSAISEQQEKNKRQRLEDPRLIDPMTGKAYLELVSIKKEQETSKQNRLSKDNSLDPFTGKNISYLNSISQKQEQNKAKRLNNPNTIDPLTGLTMSILNDILKIQAENKKTRFDI